MAESLYSGGVVVASVAFSAPSDIVYWHLMPSSSSVKKGDVCHR